MVSFKWNVASPENTQSPGKSRYFQFSAAFPQKVSFYSNGWQVLCAATTEIFMLINLNIYVQPYELWKGQDAIACLLCESTCFGYIEMHV
jgi:hypothetical protein